MQLRRLQIEDAPLMLEWMHDPDAVAHMHARFGAMTLADCQAFIQAAQSDCPNLHRAVADDKGVYLGTVSLKNIDKQCRQAEFAIAVRRAAMGQGVSPWAMNAMLSFGFAELGLQRIYWCADAANVRACRFYEKQGYHPCETTPDRHKLLWYEVTNG